MLVCLVCAAALVIVALFATFGTLLPGDEWVLGLPLNLLPALGVVALLWAAALGLGDPLRHWLLPTPGPASLLAQAALGMAALLLLFFVLFTFVAVNLATALLPIALGVLLLGAQLYRLRQQLNQLDLAARPMPWTLTALMPGLALLGVAAACPPGTLWRVEAFAYDVTSYHLQIPKEWIALGKATPLKHNVYSFFPGLMEHAYTAIGLLFGGSVRDAVYGCQLFHASFALLAVWGLVVAAQRFGPAAAAIVAGGAVLLLPWVTITGSLAYNELAVLGFCSAALAIALRPGQLDGRRGASLGLLLGAATLCKLTAGPMLVLPIVVVALLPDKLARDDADGTDTPTLLPHRLKLLAAVAVAGLLALTPYFARNALATGNPVFPFATSVFGGGHWDATLTQRWHAAHRQSAEHAGTIDAVRRQWLGNTGYGALGGWAVPPESNNVARFPKEHGLPIFWLATLTGFALMLGHPRTWRLALAMLGVLLWQLVFWRVGTHLQSRFLIYTLLPTGLVLAVGAGRIRETAHALRGVLPPIVAIVLVLTLLTTALTTLWQQTPRMQIDGHTTHQPIYISIDALGNPENPEELGRPGTHPVNLLGPDSKTLILADNSSLLYIDRPIVYSSAFDANPLGEVARAVNGDVAAINTALRAQGITHVWVVWSEVTRLMRTYGFDADLTPDLLITLSESWMPTLPGSGQAQLYRVPSPSALGGMGIVPAFAARP